MVRRRRDCRVASISVTGPRFGFGYRGSCLAMSVARQGVTRINVNGLASDVAGEGPTVKVRFTKKQGAPVRVVSGDASRCGGSHSRRRLSEEVLPKSSTRGRAAKACRPKSVRLYGTTSTWIRTRQTCWCSSVVVSDIRGTRTMRYASCRKRILQKASKTLGTKKR